MLDHLVVSGGAFTDMPREDEDEQIIIRVDHHIQNWTEDYSDHIPVAMRFILGADQD